MSENKQDLLLKLFLQLTKSDMLHFGYWSKSDPITWNFLNSAQVKYADNLFTKIPDGIQTILDVGCGTGTDTYRLYQKGYHIECVSPDMLQKELIAKKYGTQLNFYLSKFEDLNINKKFDLILMMESCQYLNLNLALVKCKELLNPQGYILLADTFRLTDTSDYKEWHLLTEFKRQVKQTGFVIEYEEDITINTVPTLEVANWAYQEYVIPITDTLTQAVIKSINTKRKNRVLYNLIKLILGKELNKLGTGVYQKVPRLLSRQNFLDKVKYMIFRLKQQ